MLKDPGMTASARTEALLFAAARAELVDKVIAPALERGETVICDRFLDSSLAYQGAGRGLGLDAVREINAFGVGDVVPHVTVLLDIDPAAAADRAGELDRFEAEGLELQHKVADAYRRLAATDPTRWRVVDAARDAATVHAEVVELVTAAR